jgi:Dolichyl-phosphate-mannose-protein mannosyltransferase
MPFVQDIIHKLELGGGMRYVRISLSVLALLTLILAYNFRGFRNMSTPEAMDSAQVGRNIAEGRGFTTDFIRPFSIYLLRKHNEREAAADKTASADLGRLTNPHPDLANPPVYPLVLAGLMKALPFNYSIAKAGRFWGAGNAFEWYEPDFLIAIFNQVLFLGVVVLVFLLARRLFDPGVAWLSAILLLGTELLWRFSVSGLSTMLLTLIFVGLTWCLVLLEQELREPKKGPRYQFVMAGVIGAMVGVGALTRYSFGWLLLPVVGFLAAFAERRRAVTCLLALAVFAGTIAPWIARNYAVSGTPFGTAGYALVEKTFVYPENKLERSLHPDLTQPVLAAFWNKLNTNLREILEDELPKLGGSWVSAFFLVGLMVGFRNPTISRLRYFLLGCLLVFVVAEALGRTQLWTDSPVVNSENLLIVLMPLVMIYGVALFFLLLDQIVLPALELRYAVIGLFGAVVCLPMIFVFLPPRTRALAYPPYYPPYIQSLANLMQPQELMMSDVPWAVAWYGDRRCLWLTLYATPNPREPDVQEDFTTINDWQKPISALYLTELTMDGRLYSDLLGSGDYGWGNLVLQTLYQKSVPANFPLSKSLTGGLPHQLFLSDWERWRKAPGS